MHHSNYFTIVFCINLNVIRVELKLSSVLLVSYRLLNVQIIYNVWLKWVLLMIVSTNIEFLNSAYVCSTTPKSFTLLRFAWKRSPVYPHLLHMWMRRPLYPHLLSYVKEETCADTRVPAPPVIREWKDPCTRISYLTEELYVPASPVAREWGDLCTCISCYVLDN